VADKQLIKKKNLLALLKMRKQYKAASSWIHFTKMSIPDS